MGLTTELWFHPSWPWNSSLTGETAKQYCDAYTKETGRPWHQPLGPRHTAYEILYDVLQRAQTLDKNIILETISKTTVTTLWGGPTKYDEKHCSKVPVVAGQWVKGKGSKTPWEIEIVNNTLFPMIPVTAKMVFPLPK